MSKVIIEQIQGLIKSTVTKIEARTRVPTSEELSAVAKNPEPTESSNIRGVERCGQAGEFFE